MTNATHTPGPWAWQDGRLIGDLDGKGSDVSFAVITNADLIAAAPDLLAALEAAVDDLESHIAVAVEQRAPRDWLKSAVERLESARAAIAKAKGN